MTLVPRRLAAHGFTLQPAFEVGTRTSPITSELRPSALQRGEFVLFEFLILPIFEIVIQRQIVQCVVKAVFCAPHLFAREVDPVQDVQEQISARQLVGWGSFAMPKFTNDLHGTFSYMCPQVRVMGLLSSDTLISITHQ